MMINPEALHPGPSRHKKRGALGSGPPKAKSTRTKPIDDGLSELYTWFSTHGRTLEGAPQVILRNARTCLTARMKLLRTLRDVAERDGQRTKRLRAQLRWLRRWDRMLAPAAGGGT